MIKVIGYKKALSLTVLAVVNAVLAALIYGYMLPVSVKAGTDQKNLHMQVMSVQADIDRMQLEFEQLDKQQDDFNALKKRGFFLSQDRGDAKKIFDGFQKESKVVTAVASIRAGAAEEDPEAQKAGYKILVSPVDILVKAFDDSDVYRYIEIAEEKFPGHLSLEKIEVSRLMDINAAVLRSIVTGGNPELIDAKISFLWRTMIPEAQVMENKDSQGAQ
jgi:hypothetical protein